MVIAADNLTFETYGLMLRRGDADFRQAVDATLARLYRSGEALTLYERWFGQLGPPSELMRGLYVLNSLPE
jgi:ABC-type amino acid transport substrate-binding protein